MENEHKDVSSPKLEELRRARREEARKCRETTYFRLQFERLNERSPSAAELKGLIRARRKKRASLPRGADPAAIDILV